MGQVVQHEELAIRDQESKTDPTAKRRTTTNNPARDSLKNDPENLVITFRGNCIENEHRIHAAVVDASGTLIYAIGDPRRVTFARSSVKPIQALAILETGAAKRFNFDDADVALMCASHSSEPRHITRAQAMLRRRSSLWRSSRAQRRYQQWLDQRRLHTHWHLQRLFW